MLPFHVQNHLKYHKYSDPQDHNFQTKVPSPDIPLLHKDEYPGTSLSLRPNYKNLPTTLERPASHATNPLHTSEKQFHQYTFLHSHHSIPLY